MFHFLNQLEENPKTYTHFPVLSAGCRYLFPSGSDWFTEFHISTVIGQPGE